MQKSKGYFVRAPIVVAVLVSAMVGVLVNLLTESGNLSRVAITSGALAGCLSVIIAIFSFDRFVLRFSKKANLRLARAVAVLQGSGYERDEFALLRLDELGDGNPDLRQRVVDEICEYLRRKVVGLDEEEEAPPTTRHWSLPSARLLAQEVLVKRLRGSGPAYGEAGFWPELSIDLRRATLVNFDFSYCETRKASFEKTRFRGLTSFRGAVFSGYALFSSAEFDGYANFGESLYNSEAAFDGVLFGGAVSFSRARFSDDAVFTRTYFGDKMRFERVAVGGNIFFDQSRFEGQTLFDRTIFGGRTSFEHSRFERPVTFHGCHFASDLGFRHARFEDVVSLNGSTVAGQLELGGAHLAKSLFIRDIATSDDIVISDEQVSAIYSGYERAAETGDTRSMINLGDLLAEQGRSDEAELWLRQAAEAGDTRALSALGDLLAEQGRSDEAELWLRQAAAAEAGDTRALSALGDLLAEQGRSDEAELWWRQAAEAGDTRRSEVGGRLSVRRIHCD